MTKFVQESLTYASGRKYTSVCYRPSTVATNSSLSDTPTCFSSLASSPRSLTQTFAFIPGSRDDFVGTLSRFSRAIVDEKDVRYELETREQETIGDMKSSKWIAYAMRAFALRFWELAKVCSFNASSFVPF